MGFVHVESLSGVMRLNVSQDMWFYLVITAPLMLVTMLGWWLWDANIRRRARARLMREKEKFKDV